MVQSQEDYKKLKRELKMTKALRHFWIGFKNAFNDDIKSLKQEIPVKELWEISNNLDRKFAKIDEKTAKKIRKHIDYQAAY